jgi:hypothetical protein
MSKRTNLYAECFDALLFALQIAGTFAIWWRFWPAVPK